jgi:hypothetical protein
MRQMMQSQENLKTVSFLITLGQEVHRLMHPCKPPIIDRSRPSENERYDLNDISELKEMGVTLKPYLPKADEYDHYPQCEWAIIECKGKSLRNSIEQLEYTAMQLLSFDKKVNRAIIIASRINPKEKEVFTKKGNILYQRKNHKPVLIPAGQIKIPVTLFSPMEIEGQYQDFGRTLDKWR